MSRISGREGHVQSARGLGEPRRFRSLSPIRGCSEQCMFVNPEEQSSCGAFGLPARVEENHIGSSGIGSIAVLAVVV